MENKFKETLTLGLKELQLELNPKQYDKILDYFLLLLEWNQKTNLTAIKDEEEIAIKHFLDSLAGGKKISNFKGKKLMDLGTGAGFPGLVLKIWQPELELILVDSVLKKVNFLEVALETLALKKGIALHTRIEDLGRNTIYREKVDIVTARAVAAMAVLAEYALPLLKKEGKFYAFKGPNYEEELEAALPAIKLLGGQVEEIYEYNLPISQDQRSLIIIKKIKATPKIYPRKAGTPQKSPLTDLNK